MAGRYFGPLQKDLRGPPGQTRPAVARARVLAERTMWRMKQGGLKTLTSSETQPDGSVICVNVQMNGSHPVVSTQIFAPTPTRPPLPSGRPLGGRFAPFIWEPEGFVLQPRQKVGATQGWGMPRIAVTWGDEYGTLSKATFTPVDEAGRGTAFTDSDDHNDITWGGGLKQVIINRFEHNKYPDHLARLLLEEIKTEIEAAGATLPADWVERELASFHPVSWPLFFEPSDPIIVRTPTWGEEVEIVGWQLARALDPSGDEPPPWKRGATVDWAAFQETINWDRWERPLQEEETDQWYCHWPEEVPYKNQYKLTLFKLVNEERAAVGRGPLTFPIRGVSDCCADIAAHQIVKHKVYGHQSHEFDEGWKNVAAKAFKDGYVYEADENLMLSTASSNLEKIGDPWPDAPPAARLAYLHNDGWVGSPPHYGAMIYDWLNEDRGENEHQTTGELLIGVASGSVNHKTVTAESWELEEHNQAGEIGVEIFKKRGDFTVNVGGVEWKNSLGDVVSWHGFPPFRYSLFGIVDEWEVNWWDDPQRVRDPEVIISLRNEFFYKGRAIRFETHLFVLGAALDREDEKFRVALFDYLEHELKVVELDVNFSIPPVAGSEGYYPDFVVLGTYPFGGRDHAVSYAHFSESGKKVVFAVASATAWSNSKWQRWFKTDYTSMPTYNIGPYYGGAIRHVEFSLEGFSEVSSWEPKCVREFDLYPVWSCGLEKGEEIDADFSKGEEGNVYADYQGEELVFAQVRLRFRLSVVFGSFEVQRLMDAGELTYPGVHKTFIIGDTELVVAWSERFHSASDFVFRELMWVDLRRPEDLIYSEIKGPTEESEFYGWVELGYSYYVQRVVKWGDRVVHTYPPRFIAVKGGFHLDPGGPFPSVDCPILAPGRMFETLNLELDYHILLHLGARALENGAVGVIGFGGGQAKNFHLSSEGFRTKFLHGDAVYMWPIDALGFPWFDKAECSWLPNGDFMFGTVSFMPVAGGTGRGRLRRANIGIGSPAYSDYVHNGLCQLVRYKDDYILLIYTQAWLYSTMMGFWMHNGFTRPTGWLLTDEYNESSAMNYGVDSDERWVIESSLDLEELTGVDNLSNNIYPLGVV